MAGGVAAADTTMSEDVDTAEADGDEAAIERLIVIQG